AIRWRLPSCAGVNVQLPSASRVPAESEAEPGTPVMLSDRVSLPSVAVRADAIDNAIEEPALPEALARFSVGALATPAITTAMLPDAVRRVPSGSVAAAVTLSVAVPAKLPAGAVKLKLASWAGVSVQLPSALCVPADSVDPLGTPDMLIDSVSVPSVEPTADTIDNGIAVPALPVTECRLSVGGAMIFPFSIAMISATPIVVPSANLNDCS